MTKMTWDNIWGDEEGDPRHDDKKTGGEVIRDDVGHHVPFQGLQHLVFNYSFSVNLISLTFIINIDNNKRAVHFLPCKVISFR